MCRLSFPVVAFLPLTHPSSLQQARCAQAYARQTDMAGVCGSVVSLVTQNTVAWLFDTAGSNINRVFDTADSNQTTECDVINRVFDTAGSNQTTVCDAINRVFATRGIAPVSYTHLTLPTTGDV